MIKKHRTLDKDQLNQIMDLSQKIRYGQKMDIFLENIAGFMKNYLTLEHIHIKNICLVTIHSLTTKFGLSWDKFQKDEFDGINEIIDFVDFKTEVSKVFNTIISGEGPIIEACLDGLMTTKLGIAT